MLGYYNPRKVPKVNRKSSYRMLDKQASQRRSSLHLVLAFSPCPRWALGENLDSQLLASRKHQILHRNSGSYHLQKTLPFLLDLWRFRWSFHSRIKSTFKRLMQCASAIPKSPGSVRESLTRSAWALAAGKVTGSDFDPLALQFWKLRNSLLHPFLVSRWR